jgi:hypothetical protein
MSDKVEPKEQAEVPQIIDPCEVPKEWNILQRMNWVRSQVGYVQKDANVGLGNNTYKAVRHDAVTAMLRSALIRAGIITTQTLKESKTVDSGSTTQKGIPIIRYEATYIIRFTNALNKEDHELVEVESHALDYGDKAPGKAMSYAKKYAYLKQFDIETGDDEESRIEQKSAADSAAEFDAAKRERASVAVSEHMDSIQAIKQGIKEANISLDKRTHQVEVIENESALSQSIEAWGELSNQEKISLWVAPSKGGAFSTDERYIMKSSKWAELNKEFLGVDE